MLPENQMTSNAIEERSVILRLEFSIADAVRHRGIWAVLREALRAWWAQTPRTYSDVPDYLREDVGLSDANDDRQYLLNADYLRLHPALWRPY